jgi:hypothetical protein
MCVHAVVAHAAGVGLGRELPLDGSRGGVSKGSASRLPALGRRRVADGHKQKQPGLYVGGHRS